MSSPDTHSKTRHGATSPEEKPENYYQPFRDVLIKQATDSILFGLKHGLKNGHAPEIDHQLFTEPLQQKRACFVTLEINGQLRGCIGSLEATRPLIADVNHNAYAAAFSDPRFPALKKNEFSLLEIHISILSPSEPLLFASEEDLKTRIRPGIDGLILEAEGKRGTFLPSVWESLPDTESFLCHLKMKAGLPEQYWSEQVRVWRYTTEMIT